MVDLSDCFICRAMFAHCGFFLLQFGIDDAEPHIKTIIGPFNREINGIFRCNQLDVDITHPELRYCKLTVHLDFIVFDGPLIILTM